MSGYPPHNIDEHTWFYRVGDKLEFVVSETSLLNKDGRCVQFVVSFKKLMEQLKSSRPNIRKRK